MATGRGLMHAIPGVHPPGALKRVPIRQSCRSVESLRQLHPHPGAAVNRDGCRFREPHLLTAGFALRKMPSFRGGVPEWPKGADCKSAGTAFGGSNPPPSTSFDGLTRGLVSGPWPEVEGPPMAAPFRFGRLFRVVPADGGTVGHRGCSSMVEPQPSKLMMWVRFPSPAPRVVPGCRGSGCRRKRGFS